MPDVVELTLSDPLEADLIVYRGDSGQFRISVSDDSGPIDISDAEWAGDIKAKQDDVVAITSFDFVPVVGDTSSVDVMLPAINSALINKDSRYDVQMTRGSEIATLMFGSIKVTKDVTRP